MTNDEKKQLDFTEKKLDPSFNKWMDSRFIEEVILDRDGKAISRKLTRK